MSELPKIYANCKAGCLWETVHKSDFEKSASLVRQYAENGRYKIEIGKEYKAVCEQTGLETFSAFLTLDFFIINGGFHQEEYILNNPANPDIYSNSFTFKILDWRDIDDTDQSEVIYEYCGVRYSHVMSKNSSIIRWSPEATYLYNFEGELYIYNADATITAKDGKSAYEIAVENGYEGTEAEWLASITGATFTPTVSADGVISWTNDKGLENPSPVNIKGEKGDKGDTYTLTEADKTEIANIALNLMEQAEDMSV